MGILFERLCRPSNFTAKAQNIFSLALDLGDKSFSKYFYLLYPWSTIQTTLKHTNSKLVERKQRPIAEGDLFRYLGVRLAMAVEPRRGPLA
ncbi:LOW QUALITY PROTEIN: Hypothetical protein PHPALM_13751, partial [Phytophthora palmivora]